MGLIAYLHRFSKKARELNYANFLLQRQLELEKIIADVSQSIIKENGHFDDVINESLKKIALVLNAENGFIFQCDDELSKACITHFCVDSEYMQNASKPKQMLAKDYPWWTKKMIQGKCISISSYEDLPAEAFNELEMLTANKCLSVAAVPLAYENNLLGFILFVSSELRNWREEQVLLLKIFSEIVACAINKNKTMLALERSEARNRAYLAAIPHSIYWIDKKGSCFAVKEEANNTLQLSSNKHYAKNIKEILSPQLAQKFIDKVDQALFDKEVQIFEYTRNQNGRDVFEEASVIPFSVDETLLVIRDLTLKKEECTRMLLCSESLIKTGQELAVDTILATFSHEIKQPLNAIKVILTSNIYLFNKNMLKETSALIEDMETVLKQSERIDKIITSTVSLMNNGHRATEPVNLLPIIEAVVQLFSYRTNSSNISVKLDIPPNLPAVIGNKEHFEQLFVNLFDNSIHSLITHNVVEKNISIFCHAENNLVFVDFIDNGLGINEGLLDKIFEPFFTTKLNQQNMGMGLAIVKSIVKAYNGKIRVSNNADGGATFHLHFNIADIKKVGVVYEDYTG